MTEQRLTDEQRAELADMLPKVGEPEAEWTMIRTSIARAILSADRGGPVAWRRRIAYSWGECWDYRDESMTEFQDPGSDATVIGEVQPLYAEAPSTPQPDTVQVPREPTPEQCRAGSDESSYYSTLSAKAVAAVYRAMIAAAPKESKE